MSNKIFSNDFDVKIKTVIQHAIHNLINSDLSANTINFLIFKLEEIRYFDFKLNTQYSENNIINDQIDITESSYQTSQHDQLVRI